MNSIKTKIIGFWKSLKNKKNKPEGLPEDSILLKDDTPEEKKQSRIKAALQKVKSKWWGKTFFIFVAILTLLIPDLILRPLVMPKLYGTLPEIIKYVAVIPTLFNLGWITLFFTFSYLILPKRWGRILYIFIGSIFIIFSFSQYVYFGIFGQFFRLSSLALAGEGAEFLSYALSYIDAKLILVTLVEILGLVVVALLWEKPKKRSLPFNIATKSIVLLPIALLIGVHCSMSPEENADRTWDAWRKPTVVYQKFTDANKCMDVAGIYHFAIRDVYKTYFDKPDFSGKDYKIVTDFFEENEASCTENRYTGMFEGKNVIVVMLEGIDDWQISDEYTPVMKYMMENGINLENHYAPLYGTGYTLGSEFCFNTGYYTPVSGVSAVNYTDNHYPYAIPALFAKKGYRVNSYHYNNAEFYNRGLMHSKMGFEKYHSFTEYGLTEWQSMSDSLVLQNDMAFEDVTTGDPFYSFIITYSGHIPYTGDDAKLVRAKENHPELIDPEMDLETNNCLILARDTDDFFRTLLEKLHESGKLDDTVIVVYTDHYAYGFSDPDKLATYSPNPNPMQVPAFIYNHGTEPLKITKPTQTSDFAPTMINLFGLENHHCYIGNDILSDENKGFVYFADYGWIDGDFIFKPGDRSDTEQTKNGQLRTQKLIEINDIVVAGDYFKHHQ